MLYLLIMEDSAQKVVHFIDEDTSEATDVLHQESIKQLNKAGFAEAPQSVDPHQKSIIEKIRILGEEAKHDVSRLTEQTTGELTSGTHYIGDTKSSKPLAIEAERQGKIAEDFKNAA